MKPHNTLHIVVSHVVIDDLPRGGGVEELD